MASKFKRRKTWWIKFQHPATGEILRESLATHDRARAELLRERLELEIALLDPRFQAVEVPDGIRTLVPVQGSVTPTIAPIISPVAQQAPHPVPVTDCNLSAWFVSIPPGQKIPDYTVLEEAMDAQTGFLHETGDVNELLIENNGGRGTKAYE